MSSANDGDDEELRRLRLEEQALRNVAALLATPGPTDDILTALCREISDQLDGQEVSLLRFNPDDYEVVAAHRGPIPVGVRAPRTPGSLPERVANTGGPVRVDDFEDEPDAELVRPFGIRAAVGVPVFVEGAVWGMFSASSQLEPLASLTERRLAGFAQLTWAAVATTTARESLRRLAEEQAALRYVAELVAHESPLPTVFQAVVDAAARLHGALVVLFDDHPDGGEQIVARAGRPPEGDLRHVRVPILVDDRPWGALDLTWPAAGGTISPDRPKAFADLIAAAIANAHHRDGLTKSRARIVAAGDEARRRLQRDVHDGAQQRLVHTIITLKIARDSAAAGHDVTDLLAEALTNAEEANRELRDIVRGILPAALTRAGLAAGIESLVADASLPVTIDLDIPRLPAAIETTGYFTVAEALTNAVKHARAGRLLVTGAISAGGSELVLTVEDDGIGGADPARGTGLTGLTDRVEAIGGSITVTSPPDAGTRITARIPFDGSTP
ncbi:GAF domain-containing sensor histidine kinase [Herbiconiux sp. P17]|uniref:GAF domain-containing sensor histidine kinase n=1 Tax=Herbiconiux wuyangfengii TaxID=3342794 RepID=UPI0035B6CFD0